MLKRLIIASASRATLSALRFSSKISLFGILGIILLSRLEVGNASFGLILATSLQILLLALRILLCRHPLPPLAKGPQAAVSLLLLSAICALLARATITSGNIARRRLVLLTGLQLLAVPNFFPLVLPAIIRPQVRLRARGIA